MKATIRDREALLLIKPLDLVAYLRANHWHEIEYHEGRYAIWLRNGHDEPTEILLPLNREYRDYAIRVAEALQTLEAVEERNQIDILTDIQLTTYDVVRIAAEDRSLENGTIAFAGGATFVEQSYQLMLAAACSTAQPRPVYYARKPSQATEYMSETRMGIARGSFVVMVHAPITPALRMMQQQSLFGEQEDPFARRVSRVLMNGLVATRQIADRAASTGEFRSVSEVVNLGVSANLCDALVGLYEGSKADQIRFRISWAPVRHAPPSELQSILISSDVIPIVKEFAIFLRDSSVRDDFYLEGYVVKLEKLSQISRRHITINGLIDHRFRNVLVELVEDDYRKATNAHRDHLLVRCNGELMREGRQYVLRNARSFEVVSQD